MNVAKRELQLKERQQFIDIGKFGVDKAVELVSNPAIALVGGYLLTNLAQNKVIGYTTADQTTISRNWLDVLFPMFSTFIPDYTERTVPAGTPLTLLTDDQANICRAALLALASSGVVKDVAGLFTKGGP